MKNIKEIFESTLNLDEQGPNYYKVGDNIQFNLDDVAKVNPGKQINDDSGEIIKVTSDGYIVKSHLDGSEFKVPSKSAYAYGSAGADGQTP